MDQEQKCVHFRPFLILSEYREKTCELIDAHSHLHCDPNFKSILESGYITVKKLCLCSSSPGNEKIFWSESKAEWKKVSEIASGPQGSQILPCFGVHPWFAHEVDPDDDQWKTELRHFLEAHPHSIIGEVRIRV